MLTERLRSQVVRAAWLWCRKSAEGREFELDDSKTLSVQQ